MTASVIRVVRILTRLNIGGPSIQAALLSTRLDPARFTTCLVIGTADPHEGELSGLVAGSHEPTLIRLAHLRRPIRPFDDAISFFQIARVLWHQRPRIIHTHMAKAGTLGRLAGWCYNRFGPGRQRGCRATLIHTFHGHVLDGYFPGWISRLFIAIEQWLARRTDVLIAVSRTVQQELLALGIGHPHQWKVIPVGLDLSALAALPLPDATSRIRFGLVGRLAPVKHPALFLEAMQRVMQSDPAGNVSASVIGDGPLRASLQEVAVTLGLERVVTFTGWQRDLPSAYAGLDVACLTSWHEGTPVSLIEAMAAGRTVIATRVGGVSDLFDDHPGRDIAPGRFRVTPRGVLVRPGDLDGIAAAMRAVAGDAALRHRLGVAARAHVIERFHQDRLLQDITQLYGSDPMSMVERASRVMPAGYPVGVGG